MRRMLLGCDQGPSGGNKSSMGRLRWTRVASHEITGYVKGIMFCIALHVKSMLHKAGAK